LKALCDHSKVPFFMDLRQFPWLAKTYEKQFVRISDGFVRIGHLQCSDSDTVL
jgi:hypothetical protein